MIKIDLNFFATLSEYLPEKNDCYEVFEDLSVEKLITDLGVPLDTVKLIFINGKREKLSYQLKNGDRVGIFPPVGGG
ncbi:MAG: MoaD/ThiS family protein [Desulfobacteraceae bacterium]|nr:MoaD/ThiS family protein [Desulfobacteraceae bacterium]